MGLREEFAACMAKLTPPAVVSAAAKLSKMTLSDWVLLATLVYTLLQIAFLLDRWVRQRRLRLQEDEQT